MSRTVINILLLVCISFCSLFLIWHMHSYRNQTAVAPPAHGYDTYLHQASLHKMNIRGQLENTLEAIKIRHYPQRNRTEFEQPKLQVFNDKGDHWIITSRQATSLEGTTAITLNDHVNIVKLASPNSGKMWMTTSKLVVHPDIGSADSDQLVTITYPQLSIHGRGLHSDLKCGTFKLLDEIGARYDPQTATNTQPTLR